MLPLGAKPIFSGWKGRGRVRKSLRNGLLFEKGGDVAYDGIRSDFTPCPAFAFAHLFEGVLVRKAEDVAGVGFWQSAH